MMKRLLALLTCIAFTTTDIIAHDFAYYEQKTRELLPILGIDETDITFVPVHKEPSREQRMANPKAIFINIEVFSKLSDNRALFECAVQAKLTQLDWEYINIKGAPLNLNDLKSASILLLLSVCHAKRCYAD
jgi:hypothetical protein